MPIRSIFIKSIKSDTLNYQFYCSFYPFREIYNKSIKSGPLFAFESNEIRADEIITKSRFIFVYTIPDTLLTKRYNELDVP